jgi:3-hydroxyacyl-[acyl-carrier-protein] dehydratase
MRLEYFQLIDRIVDIDIAARAIHTEAEVPASSTIFEGHFPNHPLMPGVLLIESMAQTAGWLVIALTSFSRMPFLAAVKDAKLRQFVTPSEKLALEASVVHEGSGYFMTRAAVRAGDKRICDADLTFRLAPFPNDSFRGHMHDMARRLAYPLEIAGHV